jgi:hypothetical protein
MVYNLSFIVIKKFCFRKTFTFLSGLFLTIILNAQTPDEIIQKVKPN